MVTRDRATTGPLTGNMRASIKTFPAIAILNSRRGPTAWGGFNFLARVSKAMPASIFQPKNRPQHGGRG